MIFSNKSATKDSARLSFNDWIQKVKDFGDKNFCTVASTIVDRQGDEQVYAGVPLPSTCPKTGWQNEPKQKHELKLERKTGHPSYLVTISDILIIFAVRLNY